MIKMIAADLDGTLLTNSKRLTVNTASAMRRAQEAGICFVPVTGRPMSGVPEEILNFPGIRYIITSNGAVTTDRQTGERLRSALLDSETAAAIAEIPARLGLIHSVFINGAGYCEPYFYEKQWAYFRDTPVAAYVRMSRRITENLKREILQSGNGVENVWMVAGDREERDRLDRMIRETWPVQTVLTAARDIEVGSREADKGKALMDLAAGLGIRREEILAIGDNENDLGMFRAAGTAAAMGNASDSVKQAADLVTDTNERDGAAMVIERAAGQEWGTQPQNREVIEKNNEIY